MHKDHQYPILAVTDVSSRDPSSKEKLKDKLEQLAGARIKLASSGKSPRQIGEESRQLVFEFIYRFGFTSADLLLLLLGRTAGGYAQKLVKQGWLTETKTASGYPVAAFYTLSITALEEAERQAERLLPYVELDPFRVPQHLIKHNLIVQQMTINALRAGKINGYKTERMISTNGCTAGTKLPDVAWITKSNHLIGIEVELSARWGRDLDDFILKIIRSLVSDENRPAQYSRFEIATDSPAIKARYEASIKPGAVVTQWKKNNRNHWVVDKTYQVPAWLVEKTAVTLFGGE